MAQHVSSEADAPHAEIRDELLEEFGDVLDHEVIHAAVHDSYTRLSSGATVRDFIGMFVRRTSRHRLTRLAAEAERRRADGERPEPPG